MLRAFLFAVCALAALALLIATIGATLALITGHARWIELAWLSIAASLFAIVLGKMWPHQPLALSRKPPHGSVAEEFASCQMLHLDPKLRMAPLYLYVD